jgi:hypothetical protein
MSKLGRGWMQMYTGQQILWQEAQLYFLCEIKIIS